TFPARSESGANGSGQEVARKGQPRPAGRRDDHKNLLYSEVRRGTQVAQGSGLQNLHWWVRIPPARPASFLRVGIPQTWFSHDIVQRTAAQNETFPVAVPI